MRKRCSVTFVDGSGVKRSVELEAESVYEAAVLALQVRRNDPLIETPPGLASRFEIGVTGPPVTHEISLVQVRNWVNRTSGNPAELVRRKHLWQGARELPAISKPMRGSSNLTNDLTN